MAKFSFLHYFTILIFSFLISRISARNIPYNSSITALNDLTYNQTRRVCDTSRFAKLGLDMNDFAYCDMSLPYAVRVKDLIDRMTLSEKARQTGDTAFGVARIGLPKYEWWSEALHGVSNVGQYYSLASFFDKVVPGATSFPTVITTTASFNESLWKAIGQAVSTEARAMFNLGHAGLTFWSPNINVVRDPRWGRVLETPGEDPFVVGKYASNYVRGLQDVEGTENAKDLNSRPLKVAACCKHYAAYDVDNWLGVDRYHFDSRVTEQDMMETFLKPFEMCVKEGDVTSVMCSYNRINGIPACADPKLLKGKIRGDWDLHGYIVSDCDSIDVMLHGHKWLGDEPEDAVAQGLKAGLDLDCGNYYTNYAGNAVVQGKVKESEIDESLTNLYFVLMRLGFFDGSPKFEKLGKEQICSKENIELATQAAREGIVLLKNEDQVLPLNSKKVKTIAIVGPHANASSAMIGNYAGIPCKITTPIHGFSLYSKVDYKAGCGEILCKNESLIFPAMKAAKKADATVLVVGLDLSVEAESLDRVDLLLPGYQTQLINQVAQVSKGPVILVIMSAGGVDISFAKNNPKIKSIIWAGYPGEEGGRAIADVVFGSYNPGGKLPLTWHENSYVDMLPMTSMPLRPIDNLGYPGRTYKFYNGSIVYPFGYGISYTNFTYNLLSARQKIQVKLNKFQHCRDLNYTAGTHVPPCPAVSIDDLECGDDLNFDFSIEVENIGKKDGSDVLMVYWIPPEDIAEAPLKQLIGFKKVFVKIGEKKKVDFVLNACKSLGIVNYRAYNLLAAGGHNFVIGNGKLSFPVQVSFHR
ncbi:beta-xylosidase/alpha-L-arabinofuranosidase 1-like isoform X1 [Nicotiana tomentosiformis]|uniref:beta-xylosidase/alpha-L-arabinofuranosidase 1-like isoform X1 n=1 Tax=Nicotiana tomentosiformis TaxID=4098 RepID=UPI00051BA01E|nr:beta-xylosidase/alpha-L-arabinofuranosidase 1-like isoform X1 [Nicotiana tomentosiformis]